MDQDRSFPPPQSVNPDARPRDPSASAPLAYLFWHWPASGIDGDVYEERMRDFHAALARPGSITFRVAGPSPVSGFHGPLYLDWYPVGGWADLGVLNAEAVSGARRAPHDAAAGVSGGGHGEVRALIAGCGPLREATSARWSAKPAGTSYGDHLAAMNVRPGPGDAIWQRQMVLGAAPELCVLSGRPSEEAHGRIPAPDPDGQAPVTQLELVAEWPRR